MRPIGFVGVTYPTLYPWKPPNSNRTITITSKMVNITVASLLLFRFLYEADFSSPSTLSPLTIIFLVETEPRVHRFPPASTSMTLVKFGHASQCHEPSPTENHIRKSPLPFKIKLLEESIKNPAPLPRAKLSHVFTGTTKLPGKVKVPSLSNVQAFHDPTEPA